MVYDYKTQRPFVFAEDGQLMLLQVMAHARKCLAMSGAVTGASLLGAMSTTFDTWNGMAVVDRLVELGYLRVFPHAGSVAWQNMVFVAGERPL